MRNTMHKKDLRKADGFPQDIDRDKTVIVTVWKQDAIIIYYDRFGVLSWRTIRNLLHPKFAEGIYILK